MTDTTTLEDKAVEILDKVTRAIEASATPAAEATLTAVWFDGMVGIAGSIAATVIGGVGIYFATRMLAEGRRVHAVWMRPETPARAPDGMNQMTVGIVGTALSGVVGVVGFASIFSAYNWAAVFYPPAAVALKVLDALS